MIDRKAFWLTFILSALLGGSVLFASTALGTLAVGSTTNNMVATALMPVIVVLGLILASRFWKTLDVRAGICLGLAVGLAGAFAICLGILGGLKVA